MAGWLRLALGAVLVAGLAACAGHNAHYDPARPHHRPDGFVNNHPAGYFQAHPWYEILWRRLRGDFRPAGEPQGGYAAFAERWRSPPDPLALAADDGQPRVTWLGHATILLQTGRHNILIDPVFSDWVGPARWLAAKRRIPPPIAIEALPRIDLVLVSHNHYDHLDLTSIEQLAVRHPAARFIVPLGVKAWFDDAGVPGASELDWWDRLEIDGLALTLTPAQHWSRRSPFDINATLWGGFFIEFAVDRGQRRFLYTGDTGYSSDFREIRRRLGPVDLLALPIGAYEPREFMRRQHINPDEALQIAEDVEARHAFGVHWGSFELSQENFDQPPLDLRAAQQRRGLAEDRFWLLRQGEIRPFPVD